MPRQALIDYVTAASSSQCRKDDSSWADVQAEWIHDSVERLDDGFSDNCPCGQHITFRHWLRHVSCEDKRIYVGSECIKHFFGPKLQLDAELALKKLKRSETHAICMRCREEKPKKTSQVFEIAGHKLNLCCRCSKNVDRCCFKCIKTEAVAFIKIRRSLTFICAACRPNVRICASVQKRLGPGVSLNEVSPPVGCWRTYLASESWKKACPNPRCIYESKLPKRA